MKLKIDEELCIGCGFCASVCPNVFKVGDDEKANVINQPGAKDETFAVDAMSGCPVNAITED